MLTISKPLSAGQAQSYHQKEFTAKEQNYWSQRGVIAGEWQGRLAEQLGLAGTVSAEDFAKLSQGQHPQTGEQLVRQAVGHWGGRLLWHLPGREELLVRWRTYPMDEADNAETSAIAIFKSIYGGRRPYANLAK